jgi:hypothetical protein
MRIEVIRAIVAATALTLAQSSMAETLDFGADLPRAGWTIVSFPGIPPASFKASKASTLEISTDASAGLLWRPFKQHVSKPYRAQWSWRADQGVAATDLTKRGADDRVLGVYFVFGEAADAAKGPLSLLSSSSVTALVYVFGGDKPRGSVLSSPHMGSRGRFMVLRPAEARKGIWFDENVDLPEDYVRAFARTPPLLLAVAISSDSDDTGARNRAKLRDLTIGK